MTVHFSSTDGPIAANLVTRATLHEDKRAPAKKGIYRSFFKRALDTALTASSIPFVLPLLALMAAMVALDGHNPLYSQLRVGKDGKKFRLWKLRTMVHNADQLLEDYLRKNPAARAEWNATQKLKNDPRITWVGRFLRKSSMDELPQLWNVLTGDMSLVGPRPMMVCQKETYMGQAYYRMCPGITGLWQVSDRNESMFSKRVEYDDIYDQIMCLRTDITILLQTIRVVLRGTGY